MKKETQTFSWKEKIEREIEKQKSENKEDKDFKVTLNHAIVEEWWAESLELKPDMTIRQIFRDWHNMINFYNKYAPYKREHFPTLKNFAIAMQMSEKEFREEFTDNDCEYIDDVCKTFLETKMFNYANPNLTFIFRQYGVGEKSQEYKDYQLRKEKFEAERKRNDSGNFVFIDDSD